MASRPFVIGVTGPIACGKSTVLGMLRALGAATVDADALYHELIAPGSPLARAIGERFGASVIRDDGSIDRRALGAIVFADPNALADLERLTHPAVIAEATERIERSGASIVALDAVKLIESGLADQCDQVWLVECSPIEQLARLMRRGGLGEAEARLRIEAQAPIEPLRARADLVIDNSGSLEETRAQVGRAWARLPILHI